MPCIWHLCAPDQGNFRPRMFQISAHKMPITDSDLCKASDKLDDNINCQRHWEVIVIYIVLHMVLILDGNSENVAHVFFKP